MTRTAEHNADHVITVDYFAYLMELKPLDRETGYEVTAIDDYGVLDGDLITVSLVSDPDWVDDALTILFGVDFTVSSAHDYALSLARCSEGTPLCRVMGLHGEYTVVDNDGNALSQAELARHVGMEYRPYTSDVFDLSNAVVGDVYPGTWAKAQ